MEIFSSIFLFLISIAALLLGASWALDSAERIGRKLKLPTLVIGVIFIGFGTSLPELIVSQLACMRGMPEVSLGNIIGSNISNIALILGISGFLVPIPISNKGGKSQIIFNLVVVLLFAGIYYFFEDFNYVAGGILVAFFIFYFFRVVLQSDDTEEAIHKDIKMKKTDIPQFLMSLIFIYLGGEYLIRSTTDLGKILGFSEYVISVIALAFGTSAPELFTALIACKKKKDYDLILGNIMGSNIFNLTLILGSTGIYNYSLRVVDLKFEIMILLILSVYTLVQAYLKPVIEKRVAATYLILYAVSIHYWITR